MQCCQLYYLTADGEITQTYQGYMQDLPKDELGSPLHKALTKKR